MLRSIPGIKLLEFQRHGLDSRCCGSGGAARKVFHENAIAMGRLTIDEAVAKKADRLILACPACYAKVNEAMQGHKNQIRITDIMELVSGFDYRNIRPGTFTLTERLPSRRGATSCSPPWEQGRGDG